MTSTTAPHTLKLPYTDTDLAEHLAQLDLDREAADLAWAANNARRTLPEKERLALVAGLVSRAAGANPMTGQLHYTPAEVLSWVERAEGMGCSTPRIGAREVVDTFQHRRIPNVRLREAYEARVAEGEQGLAASLARAIGSGTDDYPDTTHALRALGIEPAAARPGHPPVVRLFMTYEQAAAMAPVLDLDFHDIGA